MATITVHLYRTSPGISYSIVNGTSYSYNGSTDPTNITVTTPVTFSCQLASGYNFSQWVYRVGSISGQQLTTTSQTFTYNQSSDIWIRAESTSSGGGGTWEYYIRRPGQITNTYSVSYSMAAGKGEVLEISFANGGVATFSSSGGVDTIGYLSTLTTYDAATGIPVSVIASDDDSGSGNNFEFSYNVLQGTTYYLFVRPYSTGSSGTVTINIVPPGSSGTSGWYVYTSNGWVKATPYIYINGWQQVTPYIFNGTWQNGS